MDIAKRVAHWAERLPSARLANVNRYLPASVTAVLVVALVYQLVALTRTIARGAPAVVMPIAAPPAGEPSSTRTPPDFRLLLDAHLFGKVEEAAAAPVAEAVVEAPDTSLSITLKGILFCEGGMPGNSGCAPVSGVSP